MSRQIETTNGNSIALQKIERVRNSVNVKDMLHQPFFKYIKKNRLSKQEHKQFFCQYYTIVRTSYRMLAAGILSTPSEDQEMIGHLIRFIETEAGGVPTHLGHYVRWANHFGVIITDLATSKQNEKSKEFEETLMRLFSSTDSLVKQAAQVGVEDCAEVLIEGLDRGYKKYPMSAKSYGYLAIHRLLENDEDGHSRWAIDALANNPEVEDRLAELESVYRRVYDVFSGVFQGIYEDWHKAQSATA
jgi:pyrroloquinoline quinone (PQQ) biosynthesis protein C